MNIPDTPSVIINLDIVKDNLFRMAEAVKSSGCTLRPHIKTHKIPELAHLQFKYGAIGITCAKISEAFVMADAGIKDIFIAYPLIGEQKVAGAVLLNRSIRLILGVDSEYGAKCLSEAAVLNKMVFEVRIEIDSGLRRTGVLPENAKNLAGYISSLPGLKLCGIFTFKGAVIDGKSTDDAMQAGIQEGRILNDTAMMLKSDGHEIKDVSGGSTPTALYAAKEKGVTEVRPGTYIFNDMMQVKIKAARQSDCAAYILATVISTPDKSYAIIDGGSKTFSGEVPMNAYPHFLEGYGRVIDNDDLVFSKMTEEHGIITSKKGTTGLEIGKKLKIIPNHVCTTINLHENVFFTDSRQEYKKVKVAARGRLY